MEQDQAKHYLKEYGGEKKQDWKPQTPVLDYWLFVVKLHL